MKAFSVAVCLLALVTGCASVPPAAVSDLAPSGTLRAAINYGNPILAARDSTTGELRGVSVDLARELAAGAAVAPREP